jgi:DNA replication protein DnaC
VQRLEELRQGLTPVGLARLDLAGCQQRPAQHRRGRGARQHGRCVLYHRVPRLFEALAIARGDGRYARTLKVIARADLLILDDWGLATLATHERRDLLEILEDRHGCAATIVTSQLPVDTWHDVIGDPTRKIDARRKKLDREPNP